MRVGSAFILPVTLAYNTHHFRLFAEKIRTERV